MAEARREEIDPLIPKDQTGGGDDDGGNVSMGFNPGEPDGRSTPRQTKMNKIGEDTFQFPDTPGLSTTNFAEKQLEKFYPKYDKTKIFVSIENDTLKFKFIGSKKFESLFIYDSKDKKYRLNKNIERSKPLKQALGPSQLETLPVEIQNLTDGISTNKKEADDTGLSDTERTKARNRVHMQIAQRTYLQKQLVALQNGMGNTGTNIEMDTFNENDAARQQREKEIHAEIEVQETVLNADDSTPEEKARAAAKKKENLNKK